MPAVRISARRRSSLAISYSPARPGHYGVTPSPPARPISFAPNVTPGTYTAPDDLDLELSLDPSEEGAIFPPSEKPAESSGRRRRAPPGKRRSQGYIPRPPNAFMLFRADFVRQKHVPGSIETNHGSLSKIIGNCWRALPLDEKKIWEVKAKHAKAEHKARYPEYRFRPVHTKKHQRNDSNAKSKTMDGDANDDLTADPDFVPTTRGRKEKVPLTPEDELRCEQVAQFLLEGKKGDELAQAVRSLDLQRHRAAPIPRRRSSSVPAPSSYDFDFFQPHLQVQTDFGYGGGFEGNGIALPSIPPFRRPSGQPQSAYPDFDYDRAAHGHSLRRSSSALLFKTWELPSSFPSPAPSLASSSSNFDPNWLARDHSPLPDVDTSLFESSFGFGSAPAPEQQGGLSRDASFNSDYSFPPQPSYSGDMQPIDPHAQVAPAPMDPLSCAPADPMNQAWMDPAFFGQSTEAPIYHDVVYPRYHTEEYHTEEYTSSAVSYTESQSQASSCSHPSTVYSASPSPTSPTRELDVEAPPPTVTASSTVVSPQPVNSAAAEAFTDLWKGLAGSKSFAVSAGLEQGFSQSIDSHMDVEVDPFDGIVGMQSVRGLEVQMMSPTAA